VICSKEYPPIAGMTKILIAGRKRPKKKFNPAIFRYINDRLIIIKAPCQFLLLDTRIIFRMYCNGKVIFMEIQVSRVPGTNNLYFCVPESRIRPIPNDRSHQEMKT
jgi:hypothetical protein